VGGGDQGGEMIQTMYAHVNKLIKKNQLKKKECVRHLFSDDLDFFS
jgi:hypothetical protein